MSKPSGSQPASSERSFIESKIEMERNKAELAQISDLDEKDSQRESVERSPQLKKSGFQFTPLVQTPRPLAISKDASTDGNKLAPDAGRSSPVLNQSVNTFLNATASPPKKSARKSQQKSQPEQKLGA